MLNTITTRLYYRSKVSRLGFAIGLGFIIANVCSSPLNAQTTTLKDDMFQNIEAGDEGWNFISEEETKSIQDNLNQLEDYSIMNSNFDSDFRLVEEDRRWQNQGDRPNYPDYSLETEVYDY